MVRGGDIVRSGLHYPVTVEVGLGGRTTREGGWCWDVTGRETAGFELSTPR